MRKRYSVELCAEAKADLDSIFAFIAAESPSNAAGMINRIIQRLEALERFPLACALAPESTKSLFEVRQLVVRPYRVLFWIEGRTVLVLGVVHGARDS